MTRWKQRLCKILVNLLIIRTKIVNPFDWTWFGKPQPVYIKFHSCQCMLEHKQKSKEPSVDVRLDCIEEQIWGRAQKTFCGIEGRSEQSLHHPVMKAGFTHRDSSQGTLDFLVLWRLYFSYQCIDCLLKNALWARVCLFISYSSTRPNTVPEVSPFSHFPVSVSPSPVSTTATTFSDAFGTFWWAIFCALKITHRAKVRQTCSLHLYTVMSQLLRRSSPSKFWRTNQHIFNSPLLNERPFTASLALGETAFQH